MFGAAGIARQTVKVKSSSIWSGGPGSLGQPQPARGPGLLRGSLSQTVLTPGPDSESGLDSESAWAAQPAAARRLPGSEDSEPDSEHGHSPSPPHGDRDCGWARAP
jgi:hypothetical protein